MNARELALMAIINIMKDGAYANICVNEYIQKHQMDKNNRRLFTRLVYGTVEHFLKIEYLASSFLKKNTKPKLRYLIYLSIYQLTFTELPAFAVVDEAVKIAGQEGKYAASFVNGVLRNYLRTPQSDAKDLPKPNYLSIEYSHPLWLVKLLLNSYNYDSVEKILAENNSVRPISVRVNTIKIDKDKARALLEEQGLNVQDSPLTKNGFIIQDDLHNNNLLKEGKLVFQDVSAQLVTEMTAPKEDSTVLDLCAGPGGKAAHFAAYMENTGSIYALDIHTHKIKLMEKYFSLLGIKNIKTLIGDARFVAKRFPLQSFDYVLADVPCSGLGVISHKKDLKYKITPESIREVIMLQREILNNTWNLVKRGGLYIYSTCTINPNENEKQIKSFLADHTDAVIKKERLILPYEYHTDGFYICIMEKQ